MNQKPNNQTPASRHEEDVSWSMQETDATNSLPLPTDLLSWGLDGDPISEESDSPAPVGVAASEYRTEQAESEDKECGENESPHHAENHGDFTDEAGVLEDSGQVLGEKESRETTDATLGNEGARVGELDPVDEDWEAPAEVRPEDSTALRFRIQADATASFGTQNPTSETESEETQQVEIGALTVTVDSMTVEESDESQLDAVQVLQEASSNETIEPLSQPEEAGEGDDTSDALEDREIPAVAKGEDPTLQGLLSEEEKPGASTDAQEPTAGAHPEEKPQWEMVSPAARSVAPESSTESVDATSPELEDADPKRRAVTPSRPEEEREDELTEADTESDAEGRPPTTPEVALEPAVVVAGERIDGVQPTGRDGQREESEGRAKNAPSLDQLIAEIDQSFTHNPVEAETGTGPKPSGLPQQGEQHIVFSVANSQYAIPIGQVIELSKMPEVTLVPNTADFVLGVSNVRGDVISVLDLAQFLGFGATSQTLLSRMLVARVGTERSTSGFLVDEVEGLVLIEKSKLRELASPIEDRVAPFLKGVCEHDDHLLNIMDFDKVFQSSEFRQLTGV